MFIISAGSIYAVQHNTGLISMQNVSFAGDVIPNTNSLIFVFFFLMVAFALVSFFSWASNKNVIEEDDYLTKLDEFEFYRPNRDY